MPSQQNQYKKKTITLHYLARVSLHFHHLLHPLPPIHLILLLPTQSTPQTFETSTVHLFPNITSLFHSWWLLINYWLKQKHQRKTLPQTRHGHHKTCCGYSQNPVRVPSRPIAGTLRTGYGYLQSMLRVFPKHVENALPVSQKTPQNPVLKTKIGEKRAKINSYLPQPGRSAGTLQALCRYPPNGRGTEGEQEAHACPRTPRYERVPTDPGWESKTVNFLLIPVHFCKFSPIFWLLEPVLWPFLRYLQRVLGCPQLVRRDSLQVWRRYPQLVLL